MISPCFFAFDHDHAKLPSNVAYEAFVSGGYYFEYVTESLTIEVLLA